MRWQAYWEEEPWGPWRDNMHAALVAREVATMRMQRWVQLDGFIMRRPMDRLRSAESGLLSMLRMIAKKRPKVEKT